MSTPLPEPEISAPDAIPEYVFSPGLAVSERQAWENRYKVELLKAMKDAYAEATDTSGVPQPLELPAIYASGEVNAELLPHEAIDSLTASILPRNLWAKAIEIAARILEIPPVVLAALRINPNGNTPEEAAERLAATLATQAYNVHVLDILTFHHIGEKKWVTRHDDKVRATHATADGQTVPTGMPFIVGGWPMMYPADAQVAPIGLWINCRCVMVGVRDSF
jgi:hypothetical protein